MTLAPLTLRGHNPDVLTCIANLSNDEVFTPPAMANEMLDLLARAWADDNNGADIWADPDVTFLDPFTKSGVFLREIVRRLTDGLIITFPDLAERVDYIVTRQVYGIGITQLTALLARRSVYCSKYANGPHSIAKSFNTPDGNIWFERSEHTWVGGKREFRVDPLTSEEVAVYTERRCRYCGTGEKNFERGEELETHAYAFIHTDNVNARMAELFGENVQFDVIIGNPPYQLGTGGHGNQARPIYQQFVEQAKQLDPRYLVMVTPSRWFSGGMGLGEFRRTMLSDRHMRNIVDFPKLYDGFPGVKIRGGISYFLRDRDYEGPCSIQTMWDGEPLGQPVSRSLDQYDIFVRRNEAIAILEKVRVKGEPTLDKRVSSQKPFGLATNFKGRVSPVGMSDPVRVYANQTLLFVERSEISANVEWLDEWKVFMTRIQGTSAAVETKFLSKPILAGPGTASTETYIVAGHFDTEAEARRLAIYLRTRFLRFLVSLRKPTQDALKHVYGFVPDLPLDEEWTDAKLYERYGLTADEIAFVESQVAEHDDALADDGRGEGGDE
ncbi:MAG: Eco57I restriction-modification methylase domain-containing protein [Dehalococcoidia bacterium]